MRECADNRTSLIASVMNITIFHDQLNLKGKEFNLWL